MALKTTTRRNATRTRRRLLQAAIRLFAAHGFYGVAVDQIVAAARVNKRMVYHYFGSKETLYQAAFGEVYKRIESIEFHAIQRGHTPREKLARLLESYFEFLDSDPVFTRFLLWANVEEGKHLDKDHRTLTKNPFFEQFRLIVDEGVLSGQFRRDLDVSHLLIHLIGLCFIYHSNRFSLSEGLSIDLADPGVKAKGLDQVLTLVFEGITLRAPPISGADASVPKRMDPEPNRLATP